MENKPLSDHDLMQIVENNDFWVDIEGEKSTTSDLDVATSSSTATGSEEKRIACNKILNKFDESDPDESDAEELSEHDSESEVAWDINDGEIVSSENEHENTQAVRKISSWYAKDRTKWSKTAPTRGKAKQQNIIKILPGLKGPARQSPPTSPLEA